MSRIVIAFVLVLLLVLTTSAPAVSGPATGDVNAFWGLGVGVAGTDGRLAAQFSGGGGLRLRLGFRVGRLGAELQIAATGIASKLDGESAFMYAYRPAATFYVIKARMFQLLGHAGLGFGAISSSRSVQVPCAPPEECATKLGEQGLSYPGVSLDAGVTAQVHLGRDKSHAMLWLDFGGSFTRHQIEGVPTTGGIHELTLGIANAFN
ncbi:MAG: hypothetical protein H6Q90_2806 [Deltaproteobacteria bacterium]|nr:hypothetical protein [Deltaproteobacteria bacterium]